jgi:polycomb-like protein 2
VRFVFQIASVNKTERRDNILSVLTNNRNRFKCGREIKKRTTIWGLRVRLPPPAPTVTLTFAGRVSEEELREMWQGNRRLQFLSPSEGVVPSDNHMRGLMMGLAYQQNNNPSETDSPCPSPEAEREEPPHILAGCAKKTVPFSNISVQRRKRLMSVSGRDRESALRRPKRRNTNDGVCRSESEVGYLTRLSLDNKSYKNSEALSLTPPTSVSAPPTPPASGSNSLMSDDFSEHSIIQPLKNHKKLDNVELNTPCDTSGDETSSKSTLDLIIPPPKDFEGKNNPFLTLLRGSEDRPKKRRSKDTITLPLPLTAVIPGKPLMRPTKRQLSEKDIFIGPNGGGEAEALAEEQDLPPVVPGGPDRQQNSDGAAGQAGREGMGTASHPAPQQPQLVRRLRLQRTKVTPTIPIEPNCQSEIAGCVNGRRKRRTRTSRRRSLPPSRVRSSKSPTSA